MATVIKASCQDCGDVELGVGDLCVRLCVPDAPDGPTGEQGTYVFRCPTCQMSVTKPAEPRIVDLLVASGVELVRWHLPAELFEERHGPPIDHDDLLDFHLLLQRDDWFSTLTDPGADPGTR